MAEPPLTELLQYSTLEARKNQWVQKQGVDVHEDWLPFHFAYADLFYGLDFRPLRLGWRLLATVNELYELCFQLSLILWLAINNQTEDPRGLALELFGIPREFSTTSLDLLYGQRCSDPLARVATFRPLALPLRYYSEEDCSTLIEWYGFDYPDEMVKLLIGSNRRNVFYMHLPLLLTPVKGEGLAHWFLRYALRQLNTPWPRFSLRGRERLLGLIEYQAWEAEWSPWLAVQSSRLILCSATVGDYMGAGFGKTNISCRAGQQAISDTGRKLLTLCSLAPPLPAPLVVSRGLGALRFRTLPLEVVQTEEGFMSVSLVGIDPVQLGSNTYLHLHLPAGTPVLALLTRFNYQQELLLPPGTRYILHRRWEEGTLVKYEGEVLL